MTDMPTCRELIDFLDDYVAGALPAEVHRRFEEHLARCTLCVDYLATYRDTIRLSKATLEAEAAEQQAAALPRELLDAIFDAMKKRPS